MNSKNMFVALVSAGIGLICFALSSSFKDLFGDWNSLKISIYFLLSFILILYLIITFANEWQYPTTSWFKVTAMSLVITLTALYTFFVEKKVDGKPDACSLISYVAFTIMSLSLSLEIKCGFTKELMLIFVGFFIVLLTKINVLLVIPGGVFCCFILCVYYYCRNRNNPSETESDSTSLVNPQPTSTDIGHRSMLERLCGYVNALLPNRNGASEVHLHSTELATITLNEDSTSSLLASTTDSTSSQDPNSDNGLNSMLETLNGYVKTLRQEILDVSDPDFKIVEFSIETIDKINKTAKLMSDSGYNREFSHVYSSSRSECLIESLSKLGFKKLSIEDFKKLSSKEIDDEIESWIKATNVVLNILFPNEQELCNMVFFGLLSRPDLLFMDVCRETSFQLLNFAILVANGGRSREWLVPISTVYNTMRGIIMPKFESLFPNGSLQNEATKIYKLLNNNMNKCISDIADFTADLDERKSNMLRRRKLIREKSAKFESPVE